VDQFVEIAKYIGIPAAIFLFALVTGAQGHWVFGWQHREALARATEDSKEEIERLVRENARLRDELLTWQLLTLQSQGIGEAALNEARAPQPPALPRASAALTAALRNRRDAPGASGGATA